MQSIYFFRDADAELFPRVKTAGLEIPHDEPLLFDFVSLTANFRTAPGLVERLNQAFEQIFAADDGSGVTFSSAAAGSRKRRPAPSRAFTLHLDFVPQAGRGRSRRLAKMKKKLPAQTQIDEIVALIRSHQGSHGRRPASAAARKFRIAVLGRARSHLVPIAAALREAGIPFRAVELEKLATRPEVLDALALARALLNPQDRVAWLGVLRAPWCGLSLDDLHTLAGDDEPSRSPPRAGAAGRAASAAQRSGPPCRGARAACAGCGGRSSRRPAHASLGTWLEQVWLQLGGAACVDATARANLDLLWSCLDRLPGGEQDLLGPALDAALDKLTALPDPAASSDCGVQLMTIHKSKGLEFEVVIVPELQAAAGAASHRMLSWLDAGSPSRTNRARSPSF